MNVISEQGRNFLTVETEQPLLFPKILSPFKFVPDLEESKKRAEGVEKKAAEIEVRGNEILEQNAVEAEKLLKYWYGSDCLTTCQTQTLDHITGEQIEAKDIGCGKLPKPQL